MCIAGITSVGKFGNQFTCFGLDLVYLIGDDRFFHNDFVSSLWLLAIEGVDPPVNLLEFGDFHLLGEKDFSQIAVRMTRHDFLFIVIVA